MDDLDLAAGHGAVYLPFALDRKYPAAPKEFGWQYLFPANELAVDPRSGVVRRRHISDQVPQRIMREAVCKAGIDKPASIHCLRHSFATHMLLKWVNIREVQKYLGHESVETPMIYTHVLNHEPQPNPFRRARPHRAVRTPQRRQFETDQPLNMSATAVTRRLRQVAAMITLTPQMRILVAVVPVDFRNGIDGLAGMCRRELREDPLSGCVFVFRNPRAATPATPVTRMR